MTKHTTHRLNDRALKAITEPGRYADGGGLYFIVSDRRGRSFEYRYDLNGRRRYMGLGSSSLNEARDAHKAAVAQVRAGLDPIDARRAGKQVAAASISVMEAVETYVAAMSADWQTKRYPSQIRERFDSYVRPVIGHMSIADVGHAEALLVLSPIWNTMRPTAKRIRQHLERAVDMAIARGHRKDAVNPFEKKRLLGVLSFAKRKPTNFVSLPFAQAPSFFAELRQQEGVKARALEFIMLTAVRVADLVGGGKQHSQPMKWSHLDLANKLWTIPDTKMSTEHAVPLSDAAMAVLAQMQRYRDPANDVVFPGAVKGTVIANSTLRYLIRDMGYRGLATTHGMRACFKTWCEETMDFDSRIVEAALAHRKKGMEGPYHRGSFLDKRRRLMAEWANFLGRNVMVADSTVVAFR